MPKRSGTFRPILSCPRRGRGAIEERERMTLMAFLMAAGGLILLFFGGEVLLRGAVSIALRSGLSPLLIGLTIVAFATSMPELMVTVTSGLQGVTDVGIGNVIGSNIANILLILGVAAMISPIPTQIRQVIRDSSVMILATGLFILFALTGHLGYIQGGFMVSLLLLYVWSSYRRERQRGGRVDAAEIEGAEKGPCSTPVAVGLIVGGIFGLVCGSELLVRGAVDIARAAGISETVIGLTLVAFGTSLPELATGIVAALRGHTEVALGNVMGSNIFNILLIVGILAMLVPVPVAAEVINFDMWAMAAVSVLVIPLMLSGRQIGRMEGVLLVAIYLAYVFYQFDPGRVSA